jgi:hypothetical protein
MNRELEERFLKLEKRVSLLEEGHGMNGEVTQEESIIELELTLPEVDIGGLHFNKQEVHAVFEKRADGWYHSREILFMSARNSKDDNSRDILTEYLNRHEGSDSIKAQIARAMKAARVPDVEIALPEKNEGVKQYNGADCWYWLADRCSGTAACFALVYGNGRVGNTNASAVGGCAPMFRVLEKEAGRE